MWGVHSHSAESVKQPDKLWFFFPRERRMHQETVAFILDGASFLWLLWSTSFLPSFDPFSRLTGRYLQISVTSASLICPFPLLMLLSPAQWGNLEHLMSLTEPYLQTPFCHGRLWRWGCVPVWGTLFCKTQLTKLELGITCGQFPNVKL